MQGRNVQSTIAMKIRKIILKTLVFLFVFCLGFTLSEMLIRSEMRCTKCQQMDDFHLFVYAYDTKQKLDDYYKMWERLFSNELGLSPKSPRVREMIAEEKKFRPLVVVGPLGVFIDNDSGAFSVRESRTHPVPLLELESDEQSKRLEVNSLVEKGWIGRRFVARFFYSADDVYEWGFIAVFREDGKIERRYSDSNGIGVLDVMEVYENGVWSIYHLNGLVWEKVGDTNAEQKWNKRLRRNCNDERHLRDF